MKTMKSAIATAAALLIPLTAWAQSGSLKVSSSQIRSLPISQAHHSPSVASAADVFRLALRQLLLI
jgi:hypothetical protein